MVKQELEDHNVETWVKDREELEDKPAEGDNYTEKLLSVLTDFEDTEEKLRDMDREELVSEALGLNMIARESLHDYARLVDKVEAMHKSYASMSVDEHPQVDAQDDIQLTYAIIYIVKTAKKNKDHLTEEKRPRQITELEKELTRIGLEDFGLSQGAVSRITGRSKSTVNKVANNYVE